MLTALLLSFIFLVPAVGAISVTPSSTNLNPDDVYPQTFEFFVGNPDDTATGIDITVEGNLKDYIIVDSFDEIVPANGEGKVVFTINLPKNIEPGNYKGEIRAVSKEVIESGVVGVKLAVAHVVWFDLPFEGKHLKTNPVINTHPNNKVDVIAQAINDGTEDVTGAEISAILYSPDGEMLESFSGVEDVKVNSSAIVNKLITIENPASGEYKLVMTAAYDGQTVSGEKTIVLAQETESTPKGGEIIPADITQVVGQGNTVLFMLIAVVIILVGYIVLKRK